MNSEKTQFTWLGTRQQLALVCIQPLCLHNGIVVTPSAQVHSIGVTLDSERAMAAHVNGIVRSCFYQLRQLHSVRNSLTENAANTLVNALIVSRVDYCNSILYGASAVVTHRLQAVFNASARLITGCRRFDHITPALRDELH